MLQRIEEIAQPLVERQLFDSIEAVFETATLNYIQQQVKKYRRRLRKIERKYQMTYSEFQNYTKKKAQKLLSEPSLHEEIVQLEEDALDWKIAADGLKSWRQVYEATLLSLKRINSRKDD